jgi:tripartite-type tricarboxylate transporter receptor subunit TctC
MAGWERVPTTGGGHVDHKRIVATICLAAGFLAVGNATAQQWPSKPVTIVFSTAAGGPIDLIARTTGAQWEKKFGLKVLVESRPGGGGAVAGAYVTRAPADGHTLLMGGSGLTGLFVKELTYDPTKDLAPVSVLATLTYYLLVSRKMNIATFKDFVAYAKANPGVVSIGVVAAGPHDIEVNAMQEALGIRGNLIGYKGTAVIYPAMVAGEINATIGGTPPQVRTGEILALAAGRANRNPAYPEIPTFRELGVQYEPKAIFPVFVPAATPRDLMNRISAELVIVGKSDDFAERVTRAYGIEGLGTTVEAGQKMVRDEYDAAKRIADRIGIKPQ